MCSARDMGMVHVTLRTLLGSEHTFHFQLALCAVSAWCAGSLRASPSRLTALGVSVERYLEVNSTTVLSVVV